MELNNTVIEQVAIDVLLSAGVSIGNLKSIEHYSVNSEDYIVKAEDYSKHLITYTIAKDYSYCKKDQSYSMHMSKKKREAYEKIDALFNFN